MLKTVSEVAKLSGVSVRTLHYYDTVGLLSPDEVTESGYRLYGGRALGRLQAILLLRELDFPLAEIKSMLDSPDFDPDTALEQQIKLLTLKKERLERMISFARRLKKKGIDSMDFTAFDDAKQKEYARQVKEKWGNTKAYEQFKSKGLTGEDMKQKGTDMMEIFARLGKLKDKQPSDAAVQTVVGELRAFITENFYDCTKEIFAGLGQMYAAEGEMKENIDRAGGSGTAAFAAAAIEVYCG